MYNSEDTDCKVRKAKLESDRGQLKSVTEALLAQQYQMANFFEEKAAIEAEMDKARARIEQQKQKEEALLLELSALEEERARLIEEKTGLILEKNFLLKDLSSNEAEVEKTLLVMMQL